MSPIIMSEPGAGGAETVILDPSAVATNRTELDITPWLRAEGVDWGDAAVEAYLADTQVGSLPIGYRIPNRIVTVPLTLRTIGATTFNTIRQSVQAKAGLFQQEGGWIARTTSIGILYGDVIRATLKFGGDWMQASRSVDLQAVLTLECLPDWYGDEITLDDIVETTNPEIVSTLKLSAATAAIKGNYPGRVRVVVDNDQASTTQRGLLWSFRSRNYSAAATAAVAYEAESLTPLDAAATAAITGASGSGNNVVRHTSLSEDWTPVLSTQAVSGGAHMTHVGTYRVYARVYTTSGPVVSVRLVWAPGDLTFAVENDPWTFPSSTTAFYIADLGTISIDQAQQGTHMWKGAIQAKGATSPSNVSIDRLWLRSLDEASGTLSASVSAANAYGTYSARDAFNQTAGNLAGKTADVGGTWAGSGASSPDYVVDATNHVITRTTTASDAFSRIVTLPVSMTSVVAQVDISGDTAWATGGIAHAGLVLRQHVSISGNSVRVTLHSSGLYIYKVIANVFTLLAYKPLLLVADQVYKLRAAVDTAGYVFTWVGTDAILGDPLVVGYDSEFATGGALETGYAGLADRADAATTSVRTYDNFSAWVPAFDGLIYAGGSAELRWDGHIRKAASDNAWRAVAESTGDLARIPPSGLENRAVELFVKATRGDLDALPDSGIDDLSARVSYRPSWLLIPGE